ncbi:MAG: aldehyde dehydrogenase family protein, partial [Clostridia bacterium]|nr:aldehyde dehydrogenase family protein [Clostridia bacterium]
MEIYVNSEETLVQKIKQIKAAQKIYSTYTQEQVDKIFKAVATVANENRINFAKMAFEETGMGVMEDKVIKNHFASEYIYNAYKDTKTVGIVEEDKSYGYARVADPIGIIAAIIPTTNPTSTVIFKVLLA